MGNGILSRGQDVLFKKKKNRATRQFSVFLRKVHACFSRTAVQGWVGKWQEIR